MLSVATIKKTLQQHKAQLSAKYALNTIAIFGSYSRKQQNEGSDSDILVDFKHPIGIEFIDLANELEALLHQKVDLVSRNGLRPEYYQEIEKELQYV